MHRRTFLAMAALLTATPAFARVDDPLATVQAEVEDIVRRFMIEAGPIVKDFPTPRVVLSFTPALSWIKEDGSEIHTVAWSQCPSDFQGFIASLLGQPPIADPAWFFSEVFNAFLVPHEMSHFVDAKSGRLENGGRLYDGEVHANRVAVAFWLTQPGGEARLSKLMDVVRVVQGNLPNPVPVGEDRVAFFQKNYAALGANPAAYGWYQFQMFLDAWALKDQKDFKTLLAEGA